MACSAPLCSECFFTSLDSSAWIVCTDETRQIGAAAKVKSCYCIITLISLLMGMCQDDNSLTSTDISGHQVVWKTWKMTWQGFSKRNDWPLNMICAAGNNVLLFFVISQEILGLQHRISLQSNPHVHTIPGYEFSYCSKTVSQLSHFNAPKTGESLINPMLSETRKMFMLRQCPSERWVEHHYREFTAMFT